MAVFQNQASLRYRGLTTQSNITSGEITDNAGFVKTAVSQGYTPDGRITYVLSLTNGGTEDMNALVITDDLGAYSYEGQTLYSLAYTENSLQFYLNGELQPAGALTVIPGPPLTVDGLDLPAGANAVLVYEAQVTPYAPLGDAAVITNTATLTDGTASRTAAATVPITAAPALTISKSVDPTVVADDGKVTYTFVLQNTGTLPTNEEDEVSVSDAFDPVLADLVVTLDGQPMARTAGYTYDDVTGAFATVPGQITVPAATCEQNADGTWSVTPGAAVLTVSGTI